MHHPCQYGVEWRLHWVASKNLPIYIYKIPNIWIFDSAISRKLSATLTKQKYFAHFLLILFSLLSFPWQRLEWREIMLKFFFPLLISKHLVNLNWNREKNVWIVWEISVDLFILDFLMLKNDTLLIPRIQGKVIYLPKTPSRERERFHRVYLKLQMVKKQNCFLTVSYLPNSVCLLNLWTSHIYF